MKEEGNMDKNNWKEKGIEGRGKNEVHLNQGGILSEKSRNDDKMSKRWREKFVRNKEEKREINIITFAHGSHNPVFQGKNLYFRNIYLLVLKTFTKLSIAYFKLFQCFCATLKSWSYRFC